MKTYTHNTYLESIELWVKYFYRALHPVSIKSYTLKWSIKYFAKFQVPYSFLKDFRQGGGYCYNIIIFLHQKKNVINCINEPRQIFVWAMILFAPVSSNRGWMTLVLKQSLLTIRYTVTVVCFQFSTYIFILVFNWKKKTCIKDRTLK